MAEREMKMIPAHVVQFATPKGVLLGGFWLGSKRPKRVIIWLHGLGSSLFSKLGIAARVADERTAVLMFNNRGHDIVSSIVSLGKKKRGRRLGGAAHEIFSHCRDDIEGALRFARTTGARHFFLVGHSTGCQKSIFFARKKEMRSIKGIVLLAPISDWSAEIFRQGKKRVERAGKMARAMVARGKGHHLLPEGLWHELLDAKRFLSLYTPDSHEEIFPYAQPKKRPVTLEKVNLPLLVCLAQKDEFADRPAEEMAKWFERYIQKGKVIVIPGARHSFTGVEVRVVRTIRSFLSENS